MTCFSRRRWEEKKEIKRVMHDQDFKTGLNFCWVNESFGSKLRVRFAFFCSEKNVF